MNFVIEHWVTISAILAFFASEYIGKNPKLKSNSLIQLAYHIISAKSKSEVKAVVQAELDKVEEKIDDAADELMDKAFAKAKELVKEEDQD